MFECLTCCSGSLLDSGTLMTARVIKCVVVGDSGVGKTCLLQVITTIFAVMTDAMPVVLLIMVLAI